MMKQLRMMLLVLALVPTAWAQSYSAQLTGAAEAPGPGDADGSGFAVVTIDGTTVRYIVWTQNIGIATAAHIHIGSSGVPGAVVVPLDVNSLSSGTTTISQQLANEINANPSGYYVNVHNAEFPSGAVRGQLARGEGEGSRTTFLPVIGKVRGAAGTNFVSDMSIINNGGASANVTLDFFAQNAAGHTAPTVTRTVTVAPGEQKILTDVMQSILSVESGLGGVRVTSDQNVRVSARVINDLRSEAKGTAGFAFDGEDTPETNGTLAFLASDADYRTSIGYFNPNATPAAATFVARRTSDGAVLGSSSVSIPGYSMLQQTVFALIPAVPEGSRTQSSYYVTWTSDAPLLVYGAVTDNKTGDAVLSR